MILVKDLIKQLSKYKDTDQVFMYSDPEENDIRPIYGVEKTELSKSNGEGTFDAIVIVPTEQSFEENTDCKCTSPFPIQDGPMKGKACNYCWGTIK